MTMTQERYILKNQKWLIDRVSDLVGILPNYYNNFGEKIEVKIDTKAQILSSMGIELSEESLLYWVDYFQNYNERNPVQPVYVLSNPLVIKIPNRGTERVNLFLEISPFEELHTTGERILLEFTLDLSSDLTLPELNPGYYRLKFEIKQDIKESFLIVVPPNAYQREGGKTWGFHVNLWSLRGLGVESTFAHLKLIGEYVKAMGGFLSLTPLHLNDPEDIYGVSPYTALSREFKTPIYLSKPEIEEKNSSFFEYEQIWREKIEKLRHSFTDFLEDEEKIDDFRKYKESLCPLIREDLEYFAVFMFLRESFGKDWTMWERSLREPDWGKIREIHRSHHREILFYEYLQWLVDREIESLREIDLCFDLGFGSNSKSFDVWRHQEIYAKGAEYGAPPDSFNPKGQKWGYPPIIPHKLKEQGYIPFIKILRNNMKGSLLRVDHALGLFRAFWIPEGSTPKEGAYVRYPWQDLIGIICLESHINKTSIIGEDLGTAEEWFREELSKRKIASWKVFYFEKEGENFRDGSTYPENSLCSITTHDLPTFKGFWQGKDLELRRKLSIINQSDYERFFNERIKDRERIIELLEEKGYISRERDKGDLNGILLSLIKFLSNTNSKYLLIYLEDLLMIEEQTNLPGTTIEVPNWRRKLPVKLDEFLELPILREIKSVLIETGRARISD